MRVSLNQSRRLLRNGYVGSISADCPKGPASKALAKYEP